MPYPGPTSAAASSLALTTWSGGHLIEGYVVHPIITNRVIMWPSMTDVTTKLAHAPLRMGQVA